MLWYQLAYTQNIAADTSVSIRPTVFEGQLKDYIKQETGRQRIPAYMKEINAMPVGGRIHLLIKAHRSVQEFLSLIH